jgi:hypothetical protein
MGRTARVGDLARVATRDDLRRVVGQMHSDFLEWGVLESENATLAFSGRLSSRTAQLPDDAVVDKQMAAR